MKPVRLIMACLLALGLSACSGPTAVDWDWAHSEARVAAQWGEQQLVAVDLGLGFSGDFYLAPPQLRAAVDSRELLWLEFSGEVEFAAGGGELVYDAVPVTLQVRTRLQREGALYLLLEPEVKELQVEFPFELMQSLVGDTLARRLQEVLIDKPLFGPDAALAALQEQGAVVLEVRSGGLHFSRPAS